MRRAFVRTAFFVCVAVGFSPIPSWTASEVANESFRQGNALFDQNRFAEAAEAYARAIGQEPKLAEALYNRALSLEMVDRSQAIQAWQKFLSLAENDSSLKWEAAGAQARLQILQGMPAYPVALQPSRYVLEAGDYYGQVARDSETEKWFSFPVKVCLGSLPNIDWLQGAREAFNIWKDMFPLELVALPEKADIRIVWEARPRGEGHIGEESDFATVQYSGDEITSRRVAVITVDLSSRRWSKNEMRAIVLHEMGHALGLKEHSDSKKDIMYWQMQEKCRKIYLSGVPAPLVWKSLVSKPSQRDFNTLIRLYNTAGPVTRFK